jgi:amidase
VAAVEGAAELLATLGHDVSTDGPAALDDEPDGLIEYFGVAVARDLDRWGERLGITIREGDVEPRNWFLATLGRTVSSTRFLAINEAIHAWSRQLAGWWVAGGYDVLVTPTFEVPPPLLATPPDPSERRGGFTMPWDFTGQPAISLPLHWNDEGLPIGVQFVAPAWREDVLIRLAAQLEQARPWVDRHPPVAAP